MRRYSVQIGTKIFDVGLIAREGTAITFELEGQQHTVSIAPVQITAEQLSGSSRSVTQPTAAIPAAARPLTASPDQIIAPMPGIIVSFAFKVGDQVSAGQTVVVMEAMKMENNLVSPCNGKIRSLNVAVGNEVSQGQVLVELAVL